DSGPGKDRRGGDLRTPRARHKGARPRPVKRPPKASAEPRHRAVARPGRDRGERWVYGRHAVAAALANPARRWRRLAVLAGQETEAAALAEAAVAARLGEGEAVQSFDRAAFDRLLPEGAVHQGWALEVEPLITADLDDVLRAAAVTPGRSIVILLDQVSDPHNVGAILRSAAAFGARAVILAEHGAPPATGVLAKAASGA